MSVLADIGRPAAPPLAEALRAEDKVLRLRVAAVLGQLGDRRAVPDLLALLEGLEGSDPAAQAAAEALRSITGKQASELGPAVARYQALALDYLREDVAAVGHVYGEWQAVWYWDPQGKDLEHRLRYELVPSYLYYQRLAAENALKALNLDPGNTELQAILIASLSRQLCLTSGFSAGYPDGELKADAERRAGAFASGVPVACHLCGADAVGKALMHTLELGDGAASLYLVKLLGGKVGRETGEAAEALLAALDFPGAEVRCRASVEILKASPTGAIGDPAKVMQVFAAALGHAAKRTALLVSNDMQVLNKLAVVVEGQGWQVTKASVDGGAINKALDLRPAVDAVFLSAGAEPKLFKTAYSKLKSDARTAPLPLYVVLDPRNTTLDLSDYEGISAVISPDDLRAAKIEPLLTKAAAVGEIPSEGERAELVLLATQALEAVDPATTRYPLEALEPALCAALTGYGEAVALSAVRNLGRLGSAAALPALERALTREGASAELKAAVCKAIASVVSRTGESLNPSLVTALGAALEGEVQAVREAAAEALSVSGTPPRRLLEMTRKAASLRLAPLEPE